MSKTKQAASTVIRAYVVGRPDPIIRKFRTTNPVVAARRSARMARSIDSDWSEVMLVRVSGGAEFSVMMPAGVVERVEEPTGQPGPVI